MRVFFKYTLVHKLATPTIFWQSAFAYISIVDFTTKRHAVLALAHSNHGHGIPRYSSPVLKLIQTCFLAADAAACHIH